MIGHGNRTAVAALQWGNTQKVPSGLEGLACGQTCHVLGEGPTSRSHVLRRAAQDYVNEVISIYMTDDLY
jgi:hypothetical protein